MISSKYDFIKKKYRISKKEDFIDLINIKYYIIKLLKDNNIKDNYEMIANEILKNNIKNNKEYVKEINYEQELDDFKIILNKRICFYPPCFKIILLDTNNYCYLHNERQCLNIYTMWFTC